MSDTIVQRSPGGAIVASTYVADPCQGYVMVSTEDGGGVASHDHDLDSLDRLIAALTDRRGILAAQLKPPHEPEAIEGVAYLPLREHDDQNDRFTAAIARGQG